MKRILVLLLLLSPAAFADQPDRASLIAAWEEYVRGLPSTGKLESLGDDRYAIKDSELDFEGELHIKGVLIRAADTYGVETEFSHFGMIEFDLVGLPEERLGTQIYYYWLADRQTLHYSSEREGWVDLKAYQQSFTSPDGTVLFRYHLRGAQAMYGVTPDLSTFGKALANGFSVSALAGRADLMQLGSKERDGWLDLKAYQQSFTSPESLTSSWGLLMFMTNYGIWILLIALLLSGFVVLSRQQKKAKTLMDEGADINRMARENLERAERM